MQLPQPAEQPAAPRGPLYSEQPRLGITASDAQPALQSDAFKELVNKLAWSIGSTYRLPYTNVRAPARQWAITLAQHTVMKHGYPAQIGYPK